MSNDDTATRAVGVYSRAPYEACNANRRLCVAAVVLWSTGLGACHPNEPIVYTEGATVSKDVKEVVSFDVALFSYLNRPIFDVYLNGHDIGVSGVRPIGGGGSGLMTGVAVPLGPQVITWRLGGPEGMTGNGDTVKAVNQPVLVRPDNKLAYLGVHIYPDNTVELIPNEFWPEVTDRGLESIRLREQKNGQ